MVANHPSVKYSRLAAKDPEPTFNFESVFNFENGNPGDKKYQSINNYNSNFRYADAMGNGSVALNMSNDYSVREPGQQPAKWLIITSMVLTFLSYVFFVLTIPVSYFLFVKKMGEFDRLVIFRLGKMIGVRGPGRVIVFPWMDRTKRVDVRASAFAVPPQQFITADGGIVEMGAEIQYTIVDVVTMISEVADHQDILRSLGKTLLVKILVKKTVQQLERDKRVPAGDIQDEINDQVRKWGIDIQNVSLSEPKVLKQPENGSSTAMGSILKGLGMKSESKYPTPEEFVRVSHGLEVPEDGGSNTFPAPNTKSMPEQASMNMSMLQMLSSGAMPTGVNGVQLGPGIVQPPPMPHGQQPPISINYIPPSTADPGKVCNWGRCLEIILQSEFNGLLEDDACGLYKIEIKETETGTETYYIELSQTCKAVKTENDTGKTPDVTVTISSPDLGSVLEGTLAPLQAYLTGRISASGDVRKLMFFDKLSRRGHKPGTMFNI